MNHDEFAFLNHQLAAMLRDGIPLEGALRQLCGDMHQGPLRAELELLEADLAKGRPLNEALAARQLPELYTRMIQVGIRANDLPGVLTLLADYYERLNLTWTRLKGLMIYPLLVLGMALVLSCVITFVLAPKLAFTWEAFTKSARPAFESVSLWMPPVVIATLLVAAFMMLLVPEARRFARWRLPGFRESSLAQVAAAISLMLKSGVPLGDALALAAQLEQGTEAGCELKQWGKRLASGVAKFPALAAGGRTFPPLFVWLVAHGGEDLPGGFQRAADIYQARASHRAEMLLYAALPCSILILGAMIVSQAYPLVAELVRIMNMLGDY